MPNRDILQARLASGAANLARCWKIARRDGVVFGFTDHDNDLTFEGVRFMAGSGLEAHAVERSTGLSTDNSQVVGALQSSVINEADILAGRYDEAQVTQWLVDWSDPDIRILQFSGSLGEIRQGNGAFEAELRGVGEALNRPLGRAYLRSCDLDLGDAKCGVGLEGEGFQAVGIVAEIVSPSEYLWSTSEDFAEDWFSSGVLRWESGANTGTELRVLRDTIEGGSRRLRVWQSPAAELRPGDRFRLFVGCDKSHRSCHAKFGNLLNFRGFPHMPGDDWVTAYPRSGQKLDGSAVFWEDACDER